MIKQAKPDDAMTLAGLAMTLWKGNSIKEMSNMFESLISDDNAVCFLKYVDGKAIGFAQCAKTLLKACEAWAKEKHCTEFASDCELGNDDSLRFHTAMGFEETNRIICFRKNI